jgi:hypothetical protein
VLLEDYGRDKIKTKDLAGFTFRIKNTYKKLWKTEKNRREPLRVYAIK